MEITQAQSFGLIWLILSTQMLAHFALGLRDTVVERQSLVGKLSLSFTRHIADR